MENLSLRPDIPRDPVGQTLTYEGRQIALVDLGRVPSDLLRKSWSTHHQFESGGFIENAWLMPILGGGGSAASSLLAGNVFLATANPGTLMTIGSGVGSAVMGPTGVIAQAPFVAASGALIPVVAPMMLCATVLSVTICARLDRVQRTLGRLSEAVERVRRLLDAEDYARFETAAERIDEIRSELEQRRRFASDVPDRLSLVEHDVRVLRNKYGLLMTGDVHSEDDARSMVSSLERFFLASLYDLQIDMLQTYFALQNNPSDVEERQSRLQKKVERYDKELRQSLDNDPVGDFLRKLKGDLAKERWPARWLRRSRGKLAPTMRSVRAIRKDYHSSQARIGKWVKAFESAEDPSRQQSVVIYQEADGERTLRAYHTHDVRLEPAGT